MQGVKKTMSNNTISCPGGADGVPAPASLPIPRDINFALTPGRNGSEPWMVKCCEPNPVSLISGCYLWCELPASQIFVDKDGKKSTDFGQCLSLNGRNISESNIVVYDLDNGVGRVTLRGVLGVVVLGLGMFLAT
ncbi:hypothetical protein OQA88_692 [Cercophora sp. LCS_1]